ncbi:hypothetical protein SNE40_007544 [Patella caerulea]|uniref:Uncharacterized protein n=1 Tax=Patella caerulea TaxID=87958 RepID=A0AAN8Q2H2_PATCE
MDPVDKVMKANGVHSKRENFYKVEEAETKKSPLEHTTITTKRNKLLRRNFNLNPTTSGPTLVNRDSRVRLQMENLKLMKFQQHVTMNEKTAVINQHVSMNRMRAKLATYQRCTAGMPEPDI